MTDGDRPADDLPERYPACIASWPECRDGDFEPRCCRFPKSCSCNVADGDRPVTDQAERVPMFILLVPAQPAYGVPADHSRSCRACGEHFISRAGMGALVPLASPMTWGFCELSYAGCLNPRPEPA